MSVISLRCGAVAFGALCAAGGVGAGAVATAGAADSHTTKAAHTAHATRTRGHRLGALARRTVHGTVVIHMSRGFVDATFDRGTVDSVSGQTLVMTDGTPRSDYHQETLAIPSGAKVRDDRQATSLASLKPGQRVLVARIGDRTIVRARTTRPAQ